MLYLQRTNYMHHFRVASVIIGHLQTPGDNIFRPLIPEEACSPSLRTMIENCWEEDPRGRPSFAEIEEIFRQIRACVAIGYICRFIGVALEGGD
ncbi:hypothetical protein DPMN_174052 [Dreissena polymorpha]|uniref:Serine-threonine/tyrosine-protein kinase catalytic domain-containing protein n=1 Tax=Dreissena polymorpha TaxID=45954 RepID=A0A9D4E4P2_DREPO|nr:hypothetical protein DPMN_174052 [Dreissena polymorpha]